MPRIYFRQSSKISAAEWAFRHRMAHKVARDLKSKAGFAYTAALKYVSQLALPRKTGTLSLPDRSAIRHLGNVRRAAGMVC